ncbi:trehalose-phosphatase [Marinactinospora thermotolerans]|uniref:Trehalose 6-phosphate phosphatase n=1 Tax=Marinactinospora thermotolerans DSM 45154 TaxID=1122192 RepID=A0A1T4MXZ1_9ACTN|nr:trehalose-phosphatase [Marinactinospora thermotolerans]SJZ71929.1 trehalose 6-phosphatase [Marinactinospora thermotolerans DSM 45154]
MSLPSPRTTVGVQALEQILSDPRRAVLAFDFDGTLAPIVPDPRQARAHPGVVPALGRLAPLVDTVVIVTGRPAATAVEYGGLAQVPGIVVLGQYGRERWEAGRIDVPEPPPGVATVRAELPALLSRCGAPEGTWIEDKEHALAVHTRRTPDPDAALDLLRAPLTELAARTGLAIEPGRMVIEMRPPGMDKGAALTAFLTERGAGSVLYAGDDLGDLAAFDAVERARERGVAGLTVCSGSDEVVALAERADLVVTGPAGVVELLEELAAAVKDG